MPKLALALCVVIASLFYYVSSVSPVVNAAPDEAKGLPGARKVIDASQYPSLQAALDAVPEQGGLVQLPPGEFEITKPLVLRRGETQLVGAGAATHIINKNTSGEPALILAHPQGKQVAKKDRLWRVMVSNLRITGNPESGHGILAILIEEIFLQGLSVTHHGADGIRLDHCYEDPRVSDCLINYNKAIGLHLIGCHDIVVNANQFEENQDALHCIDGFNLCMNGNCIDDHLGRGVVIENTYGSVVTGNMIEECQGAALVMDRDCYGNTVSANVIAHNGEGVILKDAHGCAVSANTFTIMKKDAVRVEANAGRITLTGNNFSNSYIGDDSIKRRKNDEAAAGIRLQGSDIALTGNLFSSVRPKAIHAEKAERVSVTGNVFTDVESEHEHLQQSVEAGNLK